MTDNIVTMDMEQYVTELNATGGQRVTGVITATIRKLRIGQRWDVPVYVRMTSVKTICRLENKRNPSQVLKVRNRKTERCVMCFAKITET